MSGPHISPPPFSTRAFRDALSAFATGVTIITTRDDGGAPVGMTASSFNSVSLEPPLILWSVGRSNLSAPIFTKAERFAVHVLSSDQMDLSNRFAKSGTDKFEGLDFHSDEHGLPVLSGAIARFSCKSFALYDGGDHEIIVGEVVDFDVDSGEPLVFSKGAYAGTQDLLPKTPTPRGPSGEDGGEEGIDAMLVYHLSRAYHQLSEQLHLAVEETGLTLPQWRVLASLYGQRQRSYSDLAARVFLNTNKLDRLLDDMEQAGLCSVSRSGSGSGEERIITGTQAGHDRVAPLFALSNAHEEAALGSSDPESRRHLTMMLETIVANTNTPD